MDARRRSRALDRRLRSVLLAVRPRGRRATGTALRRVALRCERRLRRRAAAARRDGAASGRGRSRPRARLVLLDRRGRGSAPPCVRALARSSRRHPPPRRRLLHRQRRDQRRLLPLRVGGGDVVIRARALEKRYADKRILRGVTLDAVDDDLLLVIGPNGSCNAVLLRLGASISPPTSVENVL